MSRSNVRISSNRTRTSRNITSFSTSKGCYRFTRLPYGLKKAPNFV